jgi:hypothetical protein
MWIFLAAAGTLPGKNLFSSAGDAPNGLVLTGIGLKLKQPGCPPRPRPPRCSPAAAEASHDAQLNQAENYFIELCFRVSHNGGKFSPLV